MKSASTSPEISESKDLASFCARGSLVAGEPLAGSAVRADSWIVLEHEGPWDRKAERSPMPEAVRRRIIEWLESVPHARLQLIRRPGEGRREEARLFVARSDREQPWISELVVDRLDDLLEIDVPAWLETGFHHGASRLTRPVFLVCTHGRRDRCCAKWGTALFRRMTELAPERVWQTTHLGGHRFAPTLLALPEGIQYGRVDPAEAEEIVDSHDRGEMGPLERVRGRTTLDQPAQVADITLRRERNLLPLSAVTMESITGTDLEWVVRLRTGGSSLLVRVHTDPSLAVHRAPSCGAEPEAVVPMLARIGA